MENTTMLKLNRLLRNFVILALLVTGVLSTPFAMQKAYAQSDCLDPATGQQCTPTPEPPSCGQPGQPPCGGGSNPNDGESSKPKPTKTFSPAPIFFTATATYTLTATSTITASPSPTLAATTTRSAPTLTPVSDVIQAPFSTPKTVTPKSNNGSWGGITDWFNNLINRFFPDKHASVVVNDLLWLTKVNVVDANQYYCVGGPMCPTLQIPFGRKINVLIMPEGVVAPAVNNGQEEDFYPVLCFGKTGAQGCSKSLVGHRLKSSNQSGWQWSVDNYFYKPYGKSLPGVYEFEIPSAWMPSAGKYDLTAYINYNQQAFEESYDNNYVTFSITVEGNPSVLLLNPLPTMTPTLEPSDNPYYFDDTVVVLQGTNCVEGCSLTKGWVIAGQPVEIYVQPMYKQFVSLPAIEVGPLGVAAMVCKGITNTAGCADPLAADAGPYTIPQWFAKSSFGSLLTTKPHITRFTIPGNWISSSGIYAVTVYVNYNKQAGPETDMSDNMKTIYLNASALQQ
jgi:hypothetical protein